jgi:sirohydrochlorin cobaltochelatase
MPTPRLILFAHGSDDPRWRAPFERMERRLREDLGDDRVRLAYMQYAEPSLPEVVEASVRDGFRSLRVLPLFLAGGAHMAREVPEQLSEITRAHPGLEIDLLPPVGEHPGFFELIGKIARGTATA